MRFFELERRNKVLPKACACRLMRHNRRMEFENQSSIYELRSLVLTSRNHKGICQVDEN